MWVVLFAVYLSIVGSRQLPDRSFVVIYWWVVTYTYLMQVLYPGVVKPTTVSELLFIHLLSEALDYLSYFFILRQLSQVFGFL